MRRLAESREVVEERAATQLSVQGHRISFVRRDLAAMERGQVRRGQPRPPAGGESCGPRLVR